MTGTHISYYFLCHRKLWLFSNGIQMEQESDLVYEGHLIHESSYTQRPERYQEVEIEGIKIDYYDQKNKVVHEVKKSDKVEPAHEWQVKYYISILERNGIEGAHGILEYPRLRQTTEVFLSEPDRIELAKIEDEIKNLISLETCPPLHKTGLCKQCSYYEFCWITEQDK